MLCCFLIKMNIFGLYISNCKPNIIKTFVCFLMLEHKLRMRVIL